MMSTHSFNPQKRLGDPCQSSAERFSLLMAEKSQQSNSILDLQFATLFGLTTLFCIGFFNLTDIGSGDSEKVSADFTVLLKVGFLAMGGIYGAIGAFTDSRARRILFSFPVVWIWALFGFYCLGVINSVLPVVSLASAISIACVLLCTVRLLVEVGVRTVLTTLFHALSLFVVISWCLFLFVPEIGLFEEPTADGQFVKRMCGMAHSNTLGQFSGFTLVFAILLFRNYGEMSKLRWLIVALALGSLVASVSRTSLLATFVAIGFIYRDKFFRREYLSYVMWLALFSTITLLALAATTDLGAMIESKLTAISKSGDTEELMSATGRVGIWAYTIQLISEQPLFGYGAGTSKTFLSDYSFYTHNLVLNVAFSTGVLGGLACLWMIVGRLVSVIKRPHPIADALIVFVFVNGLAENVMFTILCGLPTIVWIVALSLPMLDEIDADNNRDELSVSTGGLQ